MEGVEMTPQEKAAASKWALHECRLGCQRSSPGCKFTCLARDAGIKGFLAGVAWQKKQDANTAKLREQVFEAWGVLKPTKKRKQGAKR